MSVSPTPPAGRHLCCSSEDETDEVTMQKFNFEAPEHAGIDSACSNSPSVTPKNFIGCSPVQSTQQAKPSKPKSKRSSVSPGSSKSSTPLLSGARKASVSAGRSPAGGSPIRAQLQLQPSSPHMPALSVPSTAQRQQHHQTASPIQLSCDLGSSGGSSAPRGVPHAAATPASPDARSVSSNVLPPLHSSPPTHESARVASLSPTTPLPPAALMPALAREEDEDEEPSCCICMENYTTENPMFSGECMHHFHLPCLLDWKQRSNSCPMCCSETLRGVGETAEEERQEVALAATVPAPVSASRLTDEQLAILLQRRYIAQAHQQRAERHGNVNRAAHHHARQQQPQQTSHYYAAPQLQLPSTAARNATPTLTPVAQPRPSTARSVRNAAPPPKRKSGCATM